MKSNDRSAWRMIATALLVCGLIVGLWRLPAHAMTINDWEAPLSTMTVETNFLANGCSNPPHPGYGGYASGEYHIGTDFNASSDQDVYAVGDGVVLNNNADFGSGYGRAIFIQHKDRDGNPFVVLYGHVNPGVVATGDHVTAGQKIGTIYPYTTNGPHLHLGIHPGSGVPGSPWGIEQCSAWGANGPNTNGFVDAIDYLNTHNRVYHDSDGDGFTDQNDLCPTVYGYNPHGCPIIRSDFNEDGKSDVAAFYRYDGNVTNLWVWNGGGNTTVSAPFAPWTGNGWDGARIIPAGTGHYKGEKQQDLAAFYRHDNGMLDLNVWYGNGASNFIESNAWHVNNGWDGSRIIPAGSSDFNHDGRTDVAAFYRHDNNLVDLRVWYGQSSGQFTDPSGPWSGNGWDGARIIPVGTGDLDGDGNYDIATFYRHDNGMLDLNVWYGNGSGDFTLGRPWHVDSGWEGSRIIPAGVSDVNRDGKEDMIAFYRHDNNLVDMRIWYGTSNRAMGEPGGPWSATGWDGSRIIPAGVGDYNDDQKNDVATFYRHDNGTMDMNIWYGGGDGNMYLERPWHVDSGWEGDRLIPSL